MMYSQLDFPVLPDRPFFYANFVQTLDGKVQVTSAPKEYWPLGSPEDYDTLIGLRAYADVLMHGKTTACWMRFMDSLAEPAFRKRREELGKAPQIIYAVVSAHPGEELVPILTNPPEGVLPLLITTDQAPIHPGLAEVRNIRVGAGEIDMSELCDRLRIEGARQVLVEGGPHLLSSFLEHDLIDELFLTIAPKIIGNKPGETLTLSEGQLFPPDVLPTFHLLSQSSAGDEVYLRYARA